jgi:hypothetical protein
MPRIGRSETNIPSKRIHPMHRVKNDLRLDTISPLNVIN